MAEIVLVTSEMAGRLNICAEMTRRLTRRGHRVTVAGSVDVAERFESLGASYLQLTESGSPESGDMTERHWMHQLRTVGSRRRAGVVATGHEEFHAALAECRPDLVLIDLELSMQVIVAAAAGFPIAGWTSMLSVWKRPGLPPLHTDVIPGIGWEGSRLGIEWSWLRFRLGKWLGNVRRGIRRVGADRISILRTLARQTGFAFNREAELYEWLVPCTFRSLPVLCFNAFELEFPHDPMPVCQYVGPLLDLQSGTPKNHEVASWLADFSSRRERGESTALIYAGFGAWHQGDDRGFLRRLLSAVESEPGWDLIVGLGGRLTEDEDLGPVPPNVHLIEWAPQAEILRRADLAIHHAGISTVNECITFAVPMVLYPFDFLDQRGNAARIMAHGLGEVGDRSGDSSEQIRQRLARVLSDEGMRSRLSAMREAFSVYEADDRAVLAIERFL